MLKKISVFLTLVLALSLTTMQAQVTTGTITGVVKDGKGESLPGATVIAVHTPTGAKYTTVAKKGGVFTIPNVKIGGPYQVTVSFSGFKEATYSDLEVSLGAPLNIEAQMNTTAGDLKEVVITAQGKGSVISSQRNGTSTFISGRQIQALPSVNRNVQDFARLTPQVKAGSGGPDGNGTGLSFAGQSNRYNQFSIDGSNASDAFGLGSTGTNGGQANVNPISMEAIQELQVVLSPYDVTQGGFTGGGINAVTKSGTNKLHGSLYGQFQNQDLVGKSIRYNDQLKQSARADYPKFTNKTYGASLGGPIIKNKLFFFGAVEMFRKSLPVPFDPTDKTSGSKASVDSLQKIRDFMLKNYGYDLGGFGAISNENKSNSFFARIDWNISDKHKLTLRHNYVDGSNEIRSRSATAPLFENTGYKFTDKANSSVMELNSTFSSSASNVLRVTYNVIKDARISKEAPNLAITNTEKDPTDNTKTVGITYALGSEFSSAANSLNQKILSITDNFTLYKGNHAITFGTSNEFFKSDNVFLQGFYGAYTYNAGAGSSNNINNWMNNTGMTQYQVGYSTAGRGDKAVATLKAAQLSAYVQDVVTINTYFKLTYGLRVDLPYVTNSPAENAGFNADFAAQGVSTNQLPKRRLMYSPRIGFNWDVEHNGETQVRGGLGLFTGRVPFVWISNQFSNTGIATKNLTFNAAAITTNNIKYAFDKADPQLGAFIPASSAAAATTINVIDRNFKFPQVFRANLAFDKKMGAGFVATMEGVFTKNINNGSYTNLNIATTGGTVKLGPTTRPLYGATYVNTKYAQVIELTNTNQGYAFNLTGQIQKAYSKGWAGSIAYTWGMSTSLNDLPSSVALSNWRGTQSLNGLNSPVLSASNFDMGSRITGYISKEFRYLKNLGTTITLFYNGQSGQALTYVYGTASTRNLTGDDIGAGSSATSLVYIPASFTEANFVDIPNGATASQQWADFQAFAKSNKYLGNNMGKNAERNGDRLPFENHFDLRVSEDIRVKGYKLSIFLDMLNVGAFINEKYGRSYGTGTYPDGFFPTTVNLFTPVYSGAQKQDGVAITPTTATPAFQFNIANATKIGNDYKPYNINNFTSRWSAQIGARFSF